MTEATLNLDQVEHLPRTAARRRENRLVDLCVAFAGLPAVILVALLLLIINPVFNRGPLFYRQARMGRDGASFEILKFRTMRPAGGTRAFNAPLEEVRIGDLGRFLRRHRIDELPQLLNILRGDMNLIGPRPDAYEHARVFAALIPNYIRRHEVRPGITGLAQVELGYAQGLAATRAKVAADLRYIRERTWRLDLLILWRTLRIVCLGEA